MFLLDGTQMTRGRISVSPSIVWTLEAVERLQWLKDDYGSQYVCIPVHWILHIRPRSCDPAS